LGTCTRLCGGLASGAKEESKVFFLKKEAKTFAHLGTRCGRLVPKWTKVLAETNCFLA
jgi:hypothetical protein